MLHLSVIGLMLFSVKAVPIKSITMLPNQLLVTLKYNPIFKVTFDSIILDRIKAVRIKYIKFYLELLSD